MIIKKNIVNGQEIYVQITYEEALKRKDEAETFIFTDETEKLRFFEQKDGVVDDHIKQKTSTEKKINILEMLPFLDDEEIHQIYLKILEKDPDYQVLNITSLLPFLDDDDVDKLLIQAVKDPNLGVHYTSIAPFASDEALKALVDEYVSGNLMDVHMNHLYPFLNSKDIKRLFEYYLKNK